MALLRSAAAGGHAEAMAKLGLFYENGDGVPKSSDKAIEWFELAASKGHIEAHFRLANMRAQQGERARDEVLDLRSI